ncbi:hypothetical protein ABEV36_04465 [Heyndrickxia faecalis]|uniref:prenylated flavin chaperone LpdD n=1 Tax=Heyndrickxia faecalis TaxID=2824910 RepID=UPI003D1BC4C4
MGTVTAGAKAGLEPLKTGQLKAYKEFYVTEEIAAMLLCGNFAAISGVHIDQIEEHEIMLIMELYVNLSKELIEKLKMKEQ